MTDPTYTTMGLACVTAAGLARREGEAQTVCRTTEGGDVRYRVMPSNHYAVLREHAAADAFLPLASFLPSGEVEVYPAGKVYFANGTR